MPLKSLNSLCEEVKVLTKSTASLSASVTLNHSQILASLLSRLLIEVCSPRTRKYGSRVLTILQVLDAHKADLEPESLSECRQYLAQVVCGSCDDSLGSKTSPLRLRFGAPKSHYLNRILEDFLNPAMKIMSKVSADSDESRRDLASAWILVFAGCLVLYVPDRPFDPAWRSMLARDHHKKHKKDMHDKLKALREFEMIFTGHETSLRTQLVEQGLIALGNEPEVIAIVRPQVSALGLLQGEFNSLYRSIISKIPDTTTLQLACTGDLQAIREVELLRSNIAQATLRLSNDYRAYDDITKPLVGMLLGLDVGLAIASILAAKTGSCDNAIQRICRSTPFFGMHPEYFDKMNESVNPQQDTLPSFAVIRSLGLEMGEVSVQNMLGAFHASYDSWKTQLGEEQRKDMIRSSIYRYRGNKEDSEEDEEKEFLELFPNFETSNLRKTSAVKLEDNPRLLAQHLAHEHRNVFQPNRDVSHYLFDMLQAASEKVAQLWQDNLAMPTCPVPAANMMSGLILNLEKTAEQLQASHDHSILYNFYTDANIAESRNLISLVHMIQIRFSDLNDTWPEHATIQDVLKTSSELLELRHTEPIAKIMTKAEQLHNYVNEWQVVASKEHSAVVLYDQFTALLVDWRRLELSTWSRLLDMEDKKCNDDADSWWFIAYEVIIAVPLSMLSSGTKLQGYAEQLFTTLGDFLATTSQGQYSARLLLLECFSCHSELLVKSYPTLNIVHTTLINFLSYYKHFETNIRDLLRKKRQEIETKLKEVLQLARWKDTNIIALRDSAKRSHHKLFKIIRKYRALLSHPTQDVITGGVPEIQQAVNSAAHETNRKPSTRADPQALELCRKHIRSWHTKPMRFVDPDSTADIMDSTTRMPPTAIDSASLLDAYTNDLIDNMRMLQKETPPTVNKDNSKAVKYLKSRKRKLFADTLKTIRRMGFRSNIGADVLAKQESLSMILTISPAFDKTLVASELSIAEYHFHRSIDIIPQAKQLSRNHSEDLSPTEVTRSIAYLQSILCLVMEQRSTLIKSHQELEALDNSIEKIQNLWAPTLYKLGYARNSDQSSATRVKHAVQCLPAIIKVGCVIVEKHSKLGGTDSTVVVEGLRSWTIVLANMVKSYKTLPVLPISISSSLQLKVHEQASTLLTQFCHDLHQWTEEAPGISFVLKQIKLWTETGRPPSDKHTNGEHFISIEELDNDVSKVVDSILVAIQGIERTHFSLPHSHQELDWLTRTSDSLACRLKMLHVRDVRDILEDAVCKIHRTRTEDDGILDVAAAIFAMALPIIQRYRDVQKENLDRYSRLQLNTCRLASVLAQSFSKIASEGFCMPVEDLASQSGKSEKFEEGTGLGEGEGAEDISKDIQDDEDLSELAQEEQKRKDEENVEDQEDAVDMSHDEFNGEFDNALDKKDVSASESDGEDNGIDEETGDVDDLDPSAVDEKLWDGAAGDTGKEKKGSKEFGEKQPDEHTATQDGQNKGMDHEETVDDDNLSQEGAEEGEEVAREELQKVNPHLEESHNLDLPEEMDLDHDNDSVTMSSPDDGHLDDLSDVDQNQSGDERCDVTDEDSNGSESPAAEARQSELGVTQTDSIEEDMEIDRTQDAGTPVDTEPEDDEKQNDPELLRDRNDDANIDQGDPSMGDIGGLREDTEQRDEHDTIQNATTEGNQGVQGSPSAHDNPQSSVEEGQLGQAQEAGEDIKRINEDANENGGSEAFKKLGDALEKWHRQRRQIRNVSDSNESQKPNTAETNENAEEFEHLHEEAAKVDTQALGAATEDQAHALDQIALNAEMQDQGHEFLPDEVDAPEAEDQDDQMQGIEDHPVSSRNDQEQSRPRALVGPNNEQERPTHHANGANTEDEEDIDDLDTNLSTTHLHAILNTSTRGPEEARHLWSHYDNLTGSLSLHLTEQLRLILAPTLATKLRGDFRTGKRLNIKRIIPYIASLYKRDKIWMRRSVPSKRNYQIMLSVDDSKSMGESGSGQLAFETLALVSKSLSMLEVGEICVLSFGESVTVAHDFDDPFSADAGARIFERFTFQQTTTDVRKLVAESISLFRAARAASRNASADLWQLELIISDGVCEDHDGIRRLVRQAQEERIMIVFVIVDTLRGESIMDMSEAVFEDDGEGGSKLRIRRYLDGFPFGYYLVVGDVKELPGVLATALRQWFAEVVETG